MSRQISITLLLVVIFALSASAEKKIKFTVEPSVVYGFGKTEYIMEYTEVVVIDSFGNQAIQYNKSQLEFPLDVVTGGVNLILEPADGSGLWSASVGLYTNINSPGDMMKDHDWESLTGFYDLTKWGYTESEPDMSSLVFNVQVTRKLLTIGKSSASLLVGYRYQKIEQDEIGYEGWYLVRDTAEIGWTDEVLQVSSTEPSLSYRITYKQPQFGLLYHVDALAGLTMDIKAAYTPVFFNDKDDHLLRNFYTIGDGDGKGFTGAFNLRYFLKNNPLGKRTYLGLTANLTTLNATGQTVYTYYHDVTVYDEEEEEEVVVIAKGTTFGGIPHEVNSTQYGIGLSFGMTF